MGRVYEEIYPLYVSKAFNLSEKESDLDFFDANLLYDSRLFIDPFLLKRSSVPEERELFGRFGLFFKYALENSLKANGDYEIGKLLTFLNFHEPKEINLGYTEKSNEGSGPGSKLASSLLHFFLERSAEKIIFKDSLYPNNEFNPAILSVFVDRLDHDGVSDIAANLIMDYLMKYTQGECKKLGIKTKELPVQQSFDFQKMEWTSGIYEFLPENSLRPGEPIVFVPKRLLRAGEVIDQRSVKTKIIGILKTDPMLKERFLSLISEKISKIDIKIIRHILLTEESVFKKYLETLEREEIKSYDFEKDILGWLAVKKYDNYFKGRKIDTQITSCRGLLDHTNKLVKEFTKELSDRDGWRDMWVVDGGQYKKPAREAVFARRFRGMGFAYFKWLPDVTFDYEIGAGSGILDFRVVHKDCRITIELKLLCNSSSVGKPPLKAYLHGIKIQLPKYTISIGANYAIYITGQHYNEVGGKKVKNHTSRTNEIRQLIPEIEDNIKKELPQFNELLYKNIDLSPKLSASKA
ncbi:MAG: hypothetical protein PHE52_00775 [Candidatus Pacebacteria bacterium]|nr:hypothetical protein [Candidatus Paceibacterota bacterium]